MIVVAMVIAGGLGACLRYLVDSWLKGKGTWPWGTFAVNLVGSFLLGCLVGTKNPVLVQILGVGFCGGFTTFSTAMVEHLALLRRHKDGTGMVQLCLMIACCCLAVVIGRAIVLH